MTEMTSGAPPTIPPMPMRQSTHGRAPIQLVRYHHADAIRSRSVTVLVLVTIVATFSIALISINTNLSHRIADLSSQLSAGSNLAPGGSPDIVDTTDNATDTGDSPSNGHHDNSTTVASMAAKLANLTDEFTELQDRLSLHSTELQSLSYTVDYQLSSNIKALNATVEQVQKNVFQQVQEVNDNVSSQNSLMAYQFAGTFAILGSLISFWHMTAHVRRMNEPNVQRKIIAIMWMIPIYSVSSWLGLVFVGAQAYLSISKDVYEAYVIYTFLSFLIAILGREDGQQRGEGNRDAVIDTLAKHADHLKPPLRLNPFRKIEAFPSPRHKAEAVLDQCQFFTMQFVFLRPVTTICMVVSDAIHETRYDVKYPQFYIWMVVNISIFFAFTGLVRFYHVVKNDLAWCHPFSKFLCIKGVVFMTFWQGIVIGFIASAVFKREEQNGDYESAMEWSKEAQSFLVCLEMFMFAIVHCFVFPTEEWEQGHEAKERKRIKQSFGDTLALRDFVRDVKIVMKSRKNRRKGDRLPIPQNEQAGMNNGSALMPETESEEAKIDIDWSSGWSRIEKYLEDVEGNEENENGTETDRQTDRERGDVGDIEIV